MISTLFSLLLVAPRASSFLHPGILVTDADISRIKSKLELNLDPWQSSWDKLTTIPYGQPTYINHAVSSIYRNTANGVTENAELLWHDAAAAVNLGLRWRVEGDVQYAETAAAILTAWGEKLEKLDDGDDQYLTAGLQGHQLANAAELIRDYTPFAQSGMATFTAMFERLFLAKNLFFLNHEDGSEHNVKHFFANWELCNMASVMAFGILTDNSTLFDFAVEYFKTGSGNGGINNCISNLVAEPGTGNTIGQPQEAGRDQGHTGLDFQMLGVVAQQAWNQGEDLYGFNDSRILQGAEYYARYNLYNDVPFVPYTNGIVSYDRISAASRGAHRPTWELLYAHYSQIKGLDAPWTEKYKTYTVKQMGGFEGGCGSWGEGSGHYDGIGWGSLLYHLNETDIATSKAENSSNSSNAGVSLTTADISKISASSSSAFASITNFPTTAGSADSVSTALISLSTLAATSPLVASEIISTTPKASTSVIRSWYGSEPVATVYVHACS